MNRWKFRRNTSRLSLVLASLLTLIIIVMTGVSSYAATPDAAYIHRIEGTGLTIGVGHSRDRTRASEHQQLRMPNQVLYVPGGNKSFAYLGFIFDWVQEHADLLVSAGPSPNPSEWSFPCSARGEFKIAWKKGENRGCEEGVKVQSSSKKGGLPNNNIQASRRLLAQAEDEVTVVPTPGESTIQTADSAAGISINVLVGDVRVKSARNPGGRLVKAGERYNYPQDTITPIDINPIVNSPEMQDFLNPNNWRSPDISQRVADGFSEQLGEILTARRGSPAVASNSGNNNNSGQTPLNQSPQRTATQSTQPQPQEPTQNPSNTGEICLYRYYQPGFWFLAVGGCQNCMASSHCKISSKSTFLWGEPTQLLLSCEGYSQTFVGILDYGLFHNEVMNEVMAAANGFSDGVSFGRIMNSEQPGVALGGNGVNTKYRKSCTVRVIGSSPQPPQPITP
ncbi:MAG: hypothetical protein WCD53_07310 [Microcoleus sp.]